MEETRKLKKRNPQKKESDGKRVGKIQRKKKEKTSNVELSELPQATLQDISSEKPKGKKVGLKKRKAKGGNVDISEVSQVTSEDISNEKIKGKKSKVSKTKKNKRKADEIISGPVDDEDDQHQKSAVDEDVNTDMASNETETRNRKSKKSNKKRKTNRTSTKVNEIEEEKDVYQISSGDEDCSKGMKKWVTDYYESRPGLDELQKRIDDFMTAHEERLEQERQDKEAKAAEGGWTVVVHHKGRKKTTDSESGIAVGSVSQTALENQVAKKKQSEPVAHGFYRFQRREAQRNEILSLRSKFEQDKKRIQQLRAARKFKPY